MTQRLQEVVFLYRAGHVNSGAKIMRCDQLCEIASEHLGHKYRFRTCALPHPNHLKRQLRLTQELQGCIVIFLKRADRALQPEALQELRETVRGMCVDYVDGNMMPFPEVPMDVHIAASVSGLNALEVLLTGPFETPSNSQTRAALLLHHADPRIQPNPPATFEKVSISYFGKAENAFLPEQVTDRLDRPPDYDGSHLGDSFLSGLKSCNMHYCVREVKRSNRRMSFKPLTKGFNAAASGSNMLVNRQVPDAVTLLGEDYPFLVDGATVEDVLEGIDRAEAEFGSQTWEDGLAIMSELRNRIAPAEIAGQFDGILETMIA